MGKNKELHFVGINDYIDLDGETEYIKVENGLSGFFICDKTLSPEEILKRYEESKE